MMIFFFSSRRRHTRYWRDWSSDVCSSDLVINWRFELGAPNALFRLGWKKDTIPSGLEVVVTGFRAKRSEERRVGKECRSRWAPYHQKKKGQETVGDCDAKRHIDAHHRDPI